MDIWAWTLSAQQPKTLRMVIENQDAPYGCLKFFAKEHPPVTNQGCESHFLAALGLGEAAGAAATRTMVPVVRESDGFTITLSDGVTPWTISIVVPKSRPTLMSWSSTLLSGFTIPTCNPCARNNSVLFGKVTTCPNEPEVRRTCA